MIILDEKIYLKDLRLKSGYTQKKLAILMGVDRSAVSRWENGKTIPSEEMIQRLSLIYKTSQEIIKSAIGLSIKQTNEPTPNVIAFRCSDELYNKIKDNADKANMKIGTYVARTYEGGNINVIGGLEEFNHELKQIGKNLNQLTLLCNSGAIRSPDLKNLNNTLNGIYVKLNRLLDD